MIVELRTTIVSADEDQQPIFLPCGMYGQVKGIQRDGHLLVIWHEACVAGTVINNYEHPVLPESVSYLPVACPRCSGSICGAADGDPDLDDDL